MNKQIIITGEPQRANAIATIEKLPLTTVHVVNIKEHKEGLSSRQRRLYFKWLGEICEEFGEDKDDLHLDYKGRYLVKIYRRDDPEFEAMCEAVNEMHRQGMKTDSVVLHKWIVKHTSIMDASTAQMSEYMKAIEVEATMKGVALTHPDDYDVKLKE